MKFTTRIVDLLAASTFINRLKVERRVQMDNTEFIDWNSCWVKGMYSGGLRRIPTSGAAPLLFGQAVHTGLKWHLLKKDMPFVLESALADATMSQLNMLCDPRRNTDKLHELLVSYDQHVKIVPSERLVPVELNGEPIVEQTFSFPLGTIHFKAGELLDEPCDIEVWWSGIIDALIHYCNELWVCDHKTTTVMGEKFADDKLRSSQMLGYTHIGRLFEQRLGKQVRGVLINALALRQNDFEFRHFAIPMAQWKIDEWHSETMIAVKNIIRNTVEFLSSGEAAPIREHCVTKYGKCKFFDLCESVPQVRERQLFDENLFKENPWHPIE
jgi:hypothetical protein